MVENILKTPSIDDKSQEMEGTTLSPLNSEDSLSSFEDLCEKMEGLTLNDDELELDFEI